MKLLILVVTIVLSFEVACTAKPVIQSSGGLMVEIKETTVGNLGGVDIGVGNIWEREYTLPDGTSRSGPTAQLFIEEERLIVGKGSVITVDKSRWEVVDVEMKELGTVKLKQIN